MSNALTSPVATALAQTLLHFLWQGLLIAVCYFVVQELLGVRTPGKRYLTALAAFVMLAVCPVMTFFALYSSHEASELRVQHTQVAENHSAESLSELPAEAAPARHTDATTRPLQFESSAAHTDDRSANLSLALLIWLAGVSLSGMRLLAGYCSIAWLRWGRVEIDAQLALRSQQLGHRIGLKSACVFATDRIREAAVVGFWRPIVLLPTSWMTALPTDVLEAVIAHELAHIRRHDVWVNLFQRIVETLLFYHPAVWWLSSCIRLERELCCDELAIEATGERKRYAMALERIGRLQLGGGYRLAPSFRGDRKMNLLRRVKNVLKVGQPDREPTWLIGVVAVAVPVAFLCAVGGIGESTFSAVAQDREGGRSAEADAGPRRSPEAEAGPRRSPEAEAGPRRSAEGDRQDRRPREGEARDSFTEGLQGFRPQTPREAALLRMIQQLQRDMAELKREVRGSRDGERPARRDGDRVADQESFRKLGWNEKSFSLPENWQRTKEGRVFQAYDKNGDGAVGLEEWLAMTNGNINDARRALQTKRFQSAEPSGDGKFTPAEFLWWYMKGRHAEVEGQRRDGDAARGDRDGDARERGDREEYRRDREDGERGDRVRRDDDGEERRRGDRDSDREDREGGERGRRDGDAEKRGPRDGEREKDGPRDRERD